MVNLHLLNKSPLLLEEGQFVTEQQRRAKQKEPAKPSLWMVTISLDLLLEIPHL